MTVTGQMPRKGRQSVKNRWGAVGEDASINCRVSREVKVAGQAVARREGKSFSLWLEEILRAELELPGRPSNAT